ncbi:MAG: L-histidine N(alpha)-methyltransferase [Cyanobacteria bacterium J06621_12]
MLFPSSTSRLEIDYLLDPQASEKDDIQDVINGLKQTPKNLPARYFYDQKGSQLFEQICELPEYYPTRTEASILHQYASEIVDRTQAVELVELGSGSSSKTRYLFDVYRKRDSPLYYVPVDVSDSILKTSANELLADYSQLKIQGKVATYSQALEQLSQSNLGKRMIIFLGSSIGNFNPTECDRLIKQVISALDSGDYFLLGIDLQKPQEILEAAYNDAQGITAAFNLNMLQHLNNRFGGNFKLQQFEHQAIYNQADHQIEMYLISQAEQTVTLTNLNITIELAKGEKILTEISRKFNPEQVAEYLSSAEYGLKLVKNYTDAQQKFSLLLCQLL